jgi:uncharacterized Tic20 family protein
MFGELVNQWQGLLGFGALVALIVNVLKTVGVVKDDSAGVVATALNVAGLIALLALKVFKPGADVAGLDALAAQIAQALSIVLAVVVQVIGSYATHKIAKAMNLPILGKSFS